MHDLLPHTRWLVRILRTVVQTLVLAVLKTQTHILHRRRITLEFVGDQDPRGHGALSKQLTHQPLGGMPIAAALHQHIKCAAKLIDCAPQPMLIAIDGDDDFVQMPLVAKDSLSCPNAPRGLLSKLERHPPTRMRPSRTLATASRRISSAKQPASSLSPFLTGSLVDNKFIGILGLIIVRKTINNSLIYRNNIAIFLQ